MYDGWIKLEVGNTLFFHLDLHWMPLIEALLERAKAFAVITDGSERYMPEYPVDLDLLLRAAPFMDEFPTEELVRRFVEVGLPETVIIHEGGGFHFNTCSPATRAIAIPLRFGGEITEAGTYFHTAYDLFFRYEVGGWEPVIRAAMQHHELHKAKK